MKIFLPVASRFMRGRTNTDWRYSAKLLPLLSSYCPGLSISTQKNALADALMNVRYGLLVGRRKLPLFRFIPESWAYSLAEDCPVFASDVRNKGFQALLSYERFPSSTYDLPVSWITSATDKEIWEKQGGVASEADRLIQWKWARAEKAAQLIFTTQTALDTFIGQSSESLRARSLVIPFFLPGIAAENDISAKWRQDEIKLLFVGRQAQRKGLIPVVAALTQLLEANANLSLTIVSTFGDGPVKIPNLPNIKLLNEVSQEAVLDLMRASHMLVMPSSWESYGFVYIEAMSRGCVPLALDRPVQRELLGDNGILVASQDPELIRSAVTQALDSRAELYSKALGGLQDIKERHSSEAVAKRFHEALGRITAN